MTLAVEWDIKTQTLKFAVLSISGLRFNEKLSIYQIKYTIFIVSKADVKIYGWITSEQSNKKKHVSISGNSTNTNPMKRNTKN